MDKDVYERLLQAAFHYISYRLRSIAEIRTFLVSKTKKWHIDDITVVDCVLERLKELGYADDNKFIAWWVESRQSQKPKGMRVIRQELLRKGIDKSVLDQYIYACHFSADSPSDHDVAIKALQKKLPLWRPLSVFERKKKIYSYLGRRGFEGETIAKIIDEVEGKDYNRFVEFRGEEE